MLGSGKSSLGRGVCNTKTSMARRKRRAVAGARPVRGASRLAIIDAGLGGISHHVVGRAGAVARQRRLQAFDETLMVPT